MSLDRMLAAAELVADRDAWAREVRALPPAVAWRRVWIAMELTPECLHPASLEWVFSRPRGVGPTRARRLLADAMVDPRVTVGEASVGTLLAAKALGQRLAEMAEESAYTTP